MERLVIRGGRSLRGVLQISASKNAALPLMAAAVLPHGVSYIDHIPDLRDVTTFSQVIEATGASVERRGHGLQIDSANVSFPESPYELVKKMRASFYMLGALLGRCGQAKVSLPGGCAWGPRPVNLHLEGLKTLGAEVHLEEGYVIARAPQGGLPGGSFRFEPSSVGATVNLLLAASLGRGGSRIENAAIEPDVILFCEMLVAMGAKLHGIGTRTIEVEGVPELHPVTFSNCPDRIELGTFMIAAAIAGLPGESVHLLRANPDHLGEEFLDAFQRTGATCEVKGHTVMVTPPDDIQPVSITTGIYPGFPTDLQAQWTVLLSCASGTATITDEVYGDRFNHIPELGRMGLKAHVSGNQVTVQGGGQLSGAHVMSTDLRGSVSLVLAAMIAKGTSYIGRIYHLDRGYEKLESKLIQCGVDIRREDYDEFASPNQV